MLARRFFIDNKPVNASEMVVISSLLHILHGNRPYALSRKSHSINALCTEVASLNIEI